MTIACKVVLATVTFLVCFYSPTVAVSILFALDSAVGILKTRAMLLTNSPTKNVRFSPFRRHFEQRKMRAALQMLDFVASEEIRKIIEGYRELYRLERRH